MKYARNTLMSLLAALLLLFVIAPSSSAATMTGTYVTVICPVGQSPQGLWFSGGGYQGWGSLAVQGRRLRRLRDGCPGLVERARRGRVRRYSRQLAEHLHG